MNYYINHLGIAWCLCGLENGGFLRGLRNQPCHQDIRLLQVEFIIL